MNYFPHHQAKRSASPAVRAFAAVRQTLNRDILWGQHIFKAPTLPSPRVAHDSLPFIATRITQRAPQR